jgi:hypothetical protein
MAAVASGVVALPPPPPQALNKSSKPAPAAHLLQIKLKLFIRLSIGAID